MNIDSSYTNVQSLNDVKPIHLDRVGGAIDIDKVSDDISSLSLADRFDIQKRSISQSIQNINGGIATSHIAQDGLSRQKDILENIKEQISKVITEKTSQDNLSMVKEQITDDIKQYDQIVQDTTYNNKTLLQKQGDTTDDLSIVGDTSIIMMEKVDTTFVSDELKSFLTDFTTSSDLLVGMMEVVDKGIEKLASFSNDFESAAKVMESKVKNAVKMEINTASEKSTILNTDYSKEVTDFSKSNILSQIGKVVVSQANAVQGRNIALLS